MSYALINGVNIYYETHGSGAPLVFCHEFAGDYRSWEPQVSFFSRNYEVITYSARGYSPSDVPESVDLYSQAQSVNDLRGLLTTLNIERAHIVGLSMGGNVALNFSISHSRTVLSLVVAGTGTGYDDPAPFRERVDNMANGMENEGMSFMSGYLEGPARVQLKQKDPKGYETFRNYFMQHSPIGAANTFRGVLKQRPPIYELEHKLRNLNIPTLVITGDEDDSCIQPALFMSKKIPSAGLAVFPRSGHAVNLEEPALFNRILMDFLIQVETGRWQKRYFGKVSGSLA